MNIQRVALGIAISMMAASTSLQAQSTGNLAPKSIVLVELFTSEGCSSCPPADALLSRVNGTDAGGGRLIVGISEHVNYWDSRFGWTDPYSAAIYTNRQSAYSERFHLEGVYTPQMVINGAEQIVGSDRAAFARALETERQHPPRMSLQILAATVSGSALTVHFSAHGEIPAQGADLMAVLADDSDRSNVLHGENSGQVLSHVAVARSLSRVGQIQSAQEGTVRIPLPSTLNASQKHHLILFAQIPGNGRVLGADTKPL